MKLPDDLLMSMHDDLAVDLAPIKFQDWIQDESGRGIAGYGLWMIVVMFVSGLAWAGWNSASKGPACHVTTLQAPAQEDMMCGA